MMLNHIQKLVFLLLISVFIFYSCAKVVAPTGGPKDEEHPLITEINPPDNTVNFDRKKISITFNEFIQLKDLNTNLVISPPMAEKPDIRKKGKSLLIEFKEELKDSTTYNIYFGNSVQDFNEGNPIENFQYVLSTGPFIDSLSISGQVINSYNLLPEESVYVMLYKDYEDSIPLKQIPVYISKTNKEGLFRINNIGHDRYKLFCLRDFNKNYLFDLPNEDIAFMDSLVTFTLVSEIQVDTLFKTDSSRLFSEEQFNNKGLSKSKTDNLNTQNKTKSEQEIDSIISRRVSYFPVQEYMLRLFTEYREIQYLANNARNSRAKIELVFNKPVKDSVRFTLVDTSINSDWYLKEKGINGDSITYWITDREIYKKENLSFALSYQREDSNMLYQWQTDTLKLRYYEPTQKKNEPTDTSLKYELNIKSKGTIDLNKNLNFLFETPIAAYDTSKIHLFAIVDTLEFPVKYRLDQDRIKLRKYKLEVDWCEDTVYRLEIYPKAFTDIYTSVNDTNIIEFKTQKRDFYGKVLVDIIGVDSTAQIICQLILPGKDTENVFSQKSITKDQIVEFDFLPPKEFIFKVIIDKNFNNRWDTGEYLNHVQPEEVLYHDEKIKVRSNWDIEINFDVKK